MRRLVVTREALESGVLAGLRDRMMTPDMAADAARKVKASPSTVYRSTGLRRSSRRSTLRDCSWTSNC
jgi:hypothetical protein